MLGWRGLLVAKGKGAGLRTEIIDLVWLKGLGLIVGRVAALVLVAGEPAARGAAAREWLVLWFVLPKGTVAGGPVAPVL